jgi:hypothetical protein
MDKLLSSTTARNAREWFGDLVDLVDNHPFFDWQWSIVDVAMIGLVVSMTHTL